MSIVQVQIPDSLHKSLSDLAGRDGISVDQFISTAIRSSHEIKVF